MPKGVFALASYTTTTPQQTQALANKLGQTLKPRDVVALFGGLGAGKTTFCRGLAEGLGCTAHVSSPTFDIVHLYAGAIPLAHFDAYRITSADDLEASGFYDYHEQGAVLAIEWSENILPFLDFAFIRVTLQNLGGDARLITIEGADGF